MQIQSGTDWFKVWFNNLDPCHLTSSRGCQSAFHLKALFLPAIKFVHRLRLNLKGNLTEKKNNSSNFFMC